MSIIQKTFLVCLTLISTAVFSQVRISPHLADKSFKLEANKTLLTISVTDSVDFLKKYEDKIILEHWQLGTNCFLFRLKNKNTLDDLLKDANVLFIDHHQKPKEEAELEYVNWDFNRVSKMHHFFPDLNGANQNISIKEQSFDPLNIDLLDRSFSTSLTPNTISQHSTTMATLIAGGGNSSIRTLGVASQARFTSSDFSNLLPDNLSILNANNINVQNHSYGVGIENYYGNEAFAYDQQVSSAPTLLHVFSAGNSGKLKPSSGTYTNMEFANLSGNFKQAKNVLVVNAVDTTLTVNSRNSRGPAFDGRLKPELTAFGQDGTSDAAAVVSGISLLLQQKHQLSFQKSADASLLKVILIASSDDIGPVGIDYTYGYGSVNGYKALALIDLNQIRSITLASNEQVSIPINIPSSISEIKIAVSWTDPAASPNSNTALINDIDSWLEGDGAVIQPWVLNPYPHIDSLNALPKRKPDHLNNTEYITLDHPNPGTYQLNIKSATLQGTEQKVSIAYWMNETKTFSWDFPLANEWVEGGNKRLLVWEATPDQTGDLYLQLNNSDWQLIQSGINLNHYVYWSSPDTLSKARLKMKIGIEEFVTDEFLISPSIQVKPAFVCADSIGLTWNTIKNATSYELYTIGPRYLKKIVTTPDTLIVLQKSSDRVFSVSPVFNGISGLKSETIDYTQQGAFCYVNLFSAERFSALQVRVQLHLSSWYMVDHINIFRTSHGNKSIFKNILPGKSLALDFYDTELQAGTMSYQAEITLRNGSKILSDIMDVPIEEKGKAIVFPNPVTSSSDLSILSEGGGLTFKILDLYGRVLFEKELELVMDAIDVVNLPAGMYIYHLLSQGSITDTGRFIKY